MEVLLVLAIIVAALFRAFGMGHAPRRAETSRPVTAPKPTTPRAQSAKYTAVEPARFDAKSSKHLDQKRLLTGRAWVTDGDTIKIQNTQIRLFGIDAPELNHPYGKNAKWALHKLCNGHAIRAEITETDQHGRTVARCFLPDGRDLSAEMVKQGLALDWPKFSGGKYKSFETPDARKKLFLADARQKGRMHVWEAFEARTEKRQQKRSL